MPPPYGPSMRTWSGQFHKRDVNIGYLQSYKRLCVYLRELFLCLGTDPPEVFETCDASSHDWIYSQRIDQVLHDH